MVKRYKARKERVEKDVKNMIEELRKGRIVMERRKQPKFTI